jgi:hypothetical protein
MTASHRAIKGNLADRHRRDRSGFRPSAAKGDRGLRRRLSWLCWVFPGYHRARTLILQAPHHCGWARLLRPWVVEVKPEFPANPRRHFEVVGGRHLAAESRRRCAAREVIANE